MTKLDYIEENVTLLHGDCLDRLKELNDNSVDLVFTSPPYNMRLRVRNGEYTEREKGEHFSKKYEFFSDALGIEEYYNNQKQIIEEMLRISKIVLYNIQIVTGSKEALFRLIGHFNKEIKDIIIWDKGHGQPSINEKVLNKATEMIIIFEQNATSGRKIENCYFERGTLADIWRIKRERNEFSNEHSAVFPMKLVKKILMNFSEEGDTILDPFMGTGTTGIGCLDMKRKFIGIELTEEYFKISKDRMMNRVFISDLVE